MRTALTKVPPAGVSVPADRSLKLSSLEDFFNLGDVFAKSGFFSDGKEAAQCVTKIIAGAELGFSPIASMTGIYLVKGRVTLSANMMAAAIKRSGRYDYRVLRLDDDGCEIAFTEGGQEIGRSSFTKLDAQTAKLTANDTYSKFGRNMFFARAMSNGAKWYCPDIFGGPVYTPDELCEQADAGTGGHVSAQDRRRRPGRDAQFWKEQERREHASALTPVVKDGEGNVITDPEREREVLVSQILSLASDCGITPDDLRGMVNKRFKVRDGLDSCGGDSLGQVLAGLNLRREQTEVEAKVRELVEERQSASVLEEHLAARYQGRDLGDLKLYELREVVTFLTGDETAF